MGNAAAVKLSPEAVASLRQVSATALVQAKHAAVLAHLHTTQVIRIARRYYAVVDERVLSRVQLVVEKEVVRRVERFMDEVEVKSKFLFVKTISTATIASAYGIAIEDVRHIQIGKRQYEVYNAGPELLDVPTLNKVSRFLELRDPEVIAFLLEKCLWAPWHPPTSWRMKADQIYDLTIHLEVRNEGFLTGEMRIIKLRVGRKWVGPHHYDTMEHSDKTRWLHRTDYETREREATAESVFYQTVHAAWQEFLEELARIPKEGLRASNEVDDGFSYEDQETQPSLRVKYLVETSIDKVMSDRRTMFRSVDQYEVWCMEQEDKLEYQTSTENDFAGPLGDGHIDVLAEYYESQAMATEDVKILI
ncbi:hypothetical protein Poli38472_004020 [Pythium oligandrum]|uniref:Uncharacterized protein n=1 Tax=Pythium oligandrum TaxID=41045 RepID=A0A8K1FJN6_PYTOL|nr:hypothetical protein Poli38472_004020 [Pythium oligandrum]|eukprot:TMW66255.1 hypothetical protein Poli38472_004020 [Pythium oligandrum]